MILKWIDSLVVGDNFGRIWGKSGRREHKCMALLW